MNLNPQSWQRHNGLAFWRSADGSRHAEFLGKNYTFRRTDAGWHGSGRTFRTLTDAAKFIIDSN